MVVIPEPSPENRYLKDHIEQLCQSYRRLTGRELAPPELPPEEAARWLYLEAPFPLLSHDTRSEPHFNYANRAAQKLFEMDWETFVKTPSRLSAEPLHQKERQRLLEAVAREGYIDHYRGIRISRSGRRFWIEATVWNLTDSEGRFLGQAAKILRTWPV